jgi:carboxymethylenebutenolidase
MCDNDSIHDILEFQRRAELSRRQFGAMTAGAGLMFMLPKLANAAETKESEIEIKTADGTCDAFFVR